MIPDLKGQTKGSVLLELAESVAAHHPKIDPGRLLRALWERERLSSTGIAVGVALPHAKLPELTRIVGAVGRHPDGVDFESLDGTPTRLFFLLVAPADSTGEHLKALAQVSRLIGDAEFRERLMQTADRGELYRQIVERAERP